MTTKQILVDVPEKILLAEKTDEVAYGIIKIAFVQNLNVMRLHEN